MVIELKVGQMLDDPGIPEIHSVCRFATRNPSTWNAEVDRDRRGPLIVLLFLSLSADDLTGLRVSNRGQFLNENKFPRFVGGCCVRNDAIYGSG